MAHETNRLLESHEHQLLISALELASRELYDQAKTLAACAATGGNPLVSADAAELMRQDKVSQIQDLQALIEILTDSDVFLKPR